MSYNRNPSPQLLSQLSPLIINEAKCAFCQTRFQVGQAYIECPNCNTPHHWDCWKENRDTCSNITCQSRVITPPITIDPMPPTPFSPPGGGGASPQQGCNLARSGCGCLTTLAVPILGWLVYGSLGAAFWSYLLFFALSIIALLGIVPVAGPFFYWNIVNDTVMPGIMEAGHLTSTWLTTGIFWVNFVFSILLSIGSSLGIIVGIGWVISRVRRGY
jgi:hypothetical protein